VVSVVLLMALSVFDVGRAYQAYMAVAQLARDGARIAADDCNLNDAQIRSAVQAAAGSMTVSVVVTPNPRSANCVGSTTVTVHYVHDWITPMGNLVSGSGSTTITSHMVSR
jgi:Flp pilus assembly protein TadG